MLLLSLTQFIFSGLDFYYQKKKYILGLLIKGK